MTEIIVASGWQHILDEAVADASRLPDEWCFEIANAKRAADGSLRIDASYNPFDVPWDESVPHPWRAWQKIKRKAQERSLVTCECCGRMGKLVGADQEARVRCAAHADVVDAMTWQPPEGVMFETDEEATAHFLSDYGDGVDFIRELAQEDDDNKGSRH